MYVPAAQMEGEALKLFHTWFSPSLLVRSSAPSAVTMQALRDAVAKVDPELPVASFRTLDEIRARTLVRQRMQAVLLAVMAALALLLSGVGLYGLVAHSVVERTREFGIRMALGATKGRVFSSVIASGMTPAICGVLLGAVLARAAARLLSTMIWGIPPGDPLTFAGVVTLLLLVAAVASSVPALKVLGLDPARVLRLD
jgi:ABC-type antimicrobial peptide transport system permease subunit